MTARCQDCGRLFNYALENGAPRTDLPTRCEPHYRQWHLDMFGFASFDEE